MVDITEDMREMQGDIYYILQSQETILPSTTQQWEALAPLRDALPALQDLPAAAQEDLQRAFRHSVSVTDALLDHAIRLSMAAELGPDYTRSVHAKTIRDLVGQLLLHTRQPGGHSVDEVASAAARLLLAEQVPQRLAAHLHHRYKVGDPASWHHRWQTADACMSETVCAALLCSACMYRMSLSRSTHDNANNANTDNTCLPCWRASTDGNLTSTSTCARTA